MKTTAHTVNIYWLFLGLPVDLQHIVITTRKQLHLTARLPPLPPLVECGVMAVL